MDEEIRSQLIDVLLNSGVKPDEVRKMTDEEIYEWISKLQEEEGVEENNANDFLPGNKKFQDRIYYGDSVDWDDEPFEIYNTFVSDYEKFIDQYTDGIYPDAIFNKSL